MYASFYIIKQDTAEPNRQKKMGTLMSSLGKHRLKQLKFYLKILVS